MRVLKKKNCRLHHEKNVTGLDGIQKIVFGRWKGFECGVQGS